MPEATNVESVRAFFEKVLNVGDLASLESFSHRNVVVAQSPTGLDGFKRHLSEMRGAFASPEYKVMDVISDGEKVAVRFSAKATHSGRYMGIPATGRAIKLWGVMIFRFEAGAIAEFWSLVDSEGVLRQLRES